MKTLASILVIAGLVALFFGVVYAVSTLFALPQTANVQPVLTVSATINSAAWTSGTSLNWGTVAAGTYTKTLAITNTGNVAVTVTFSTANLPSGWTETWGTNTATIQPQATETRDLTLTVPADPAPGTFSFTSSLT